MWTFLGVLSVSLCATASAKADAVADFYHGKTIQFVVGAAAGGGFDLTARPLAKYMSKYLPGHPTIVIRNMPGAAGMIMTNNLANAAPADGTVIGMSTSSVPFEPRLKVLSPDGSNVKFDPQKLRWIGTPMREPQVSWVWHASGINTWEDMKTKKARFGATSVAGDNAIFPALANQLLGLNAQIVMGYQGIGEIYLAIERGELEANNTAYSNLAIGKPDWVREGKARIIMQFGLEKLPALKEVPSIVDLVKNEDDLRMLRFLLLKFEMSRPIFAPAKTPQDRVDALRAAFDQAVRDPEFLAEAQKLGLDIDPLGGQAVEKLVDEVMTTPQPVVDRLRRAIAKLGVK